MFCVFSHIPWHNFLFTFKFLENAAKCHWILPELTLHWNLVFLCIQEFMCSVSTLNVDTNQGFYLWNQLLTNSFWKVKIKKMARLFAILKIEQKPCRNKLTVPTFFPSGVWLGATVTAVAATGRPTVVQGGRGCWQSDAGYWYSHKLFVYSQGKPNEYKWYFKFNYFI